MKLSAPTISGNFDSRLVATMEDGSQRTIWEKRYPAKGLDRWSICRARKPVHAHAVATSGTCWGHSAFNIRVCSVASSGDMLLAGTTLRSGQCS